MVEESKSRRDYILKYESLVQKWWEEGHVFRSDADPKEFPLMPVALMQHHWTVGFKCNANIVLNSGKMSKSTGKSWTLGEAIQEFSADATRFSLADASYSKDKPKFVVETANAAILRLTKEIAWIKAIFMDSSLRMDNNTTVYADHVFTNEMNIAIELTKKNYSEGLFREALISGFYDLQAARDKYRLSCKESGSNCRMKWILLWQFMVIQTQLIAPICPHYAEYVWRELLRKKGYVIKAGWPKADSPNLILKMADKYLQDSIVSLRKLWETQATGGLKKDRSNPLNFKYLPTIGLIFVKEEYDGWRRECLNILQKKFDRETGTFAPDSEILSELQNSEIEGQVGNFEQIQNRYMPFLILKKKEVNTIGVQSIDLKLPFSELEVLSKNSEYIKNQLLLYCLEVFSATDDAVAKAGYHASLLSSNQPSPGNPTAIFWK